MQGPQRPQREPVSPVDFYRERVLPRLSAETVFSGVDFKTCRGRDWRGPCPFHEGKDPNFAVNPETLRWKCYSSDCGNGDALDYLAKGASLPLPLKGRDFVEAVKLAAALAGVDASPLEREPTPAETAHRQRGSLLEAFLEYARLSLEKPEGLAAREYLKGRGFVSAEDLADFGLFTTLDKVRGMLEAAGFKRDEVEASGLLNPGWTGRLVIPWRDRSGHLETFAARILPGKAEEEGAKYLYLTGTRKADLVAFGLDVALRNGGRERLVLVEGLLDVLALHARGVRNVAAIGGNGKELSAERWEALAGFGVREAVLVLDHDDAGREGTLAALENADKGRKAPKVYVVDPAHLAGCKDPADLVLLAGANASGAFRALLEKRTSGARFRGEELLRNVTPEAPDAVRHAGAEAVVGLVNGLRGPLAGLDAEDLRRLASERTGYAEETLADMAGSLAELRREEDAERRVDSALRDAQAARSNGKPTREVRRILREVLHATEASTEEPPPPFSVERLERESQALPVGRPSGWQAVDALGVRFNPGELGLAVARTSHAKTSFLVGLLLSWLKTPGEDLFVFYSLEEPEVRIFHRLLALLSWDSGTSSGWSADEVRDYLRDPASRSWTGSPALLNHARETLRSWEDRLLVVPRPSWNVDRLAAHARELAGERRVGAVLVDYLQRLAPPEASFDRRDLEVSAVGRALKTLAVDLSAPVVAGAQVNRDAVPEKYGEKLAGKSYADAKDVIRKARPGLHNLREGGSEQEVDLVLGLLNYAADFQREAPAGEDANRPPDATLLEVGTLKNRYGETGRWARLAFEGRFHLIRDPYGDGEDL